MAIFIWSWLINLFQLSKDSKTKGDTNMNWLALLESVLNAIVIVGKDVGKPWDQVLIDVINHLTPGKPNAPALS